MLGDVTAVNGEREEEVKEEVLKDEMDEDEESSPPGSFPELVKQIKFL